MISGNTVSKTGSELFLRAAGIYPCISKKTERQTRYEASILFEESKSRLNDINNWHQLCNEPHPVFLHTDPTGKPVFTTYPERGDLVRVTKNNPKSGVYFEWLRIEGFEKGVDELNDEEFYGFNLRPVYDPYLPKDPKRGIYTSSRINTFYIARKKNKVEALEKESENSFRPISLLRRIRAILYSWLFSLGFYNSQWKRLVQGLISSSKS